MINYDKNQIYIYNIYLYIIYTKSSTKMRRRTSAAIKFGINQQNFSPSTT